MLHGPNLRKVRLMTKEALCRHEAPVSDRVPRRVRTHLEGRGGQYHKWHSVGESVYLLRVLRGQDVDLSPGSFAYIANSDPTNQGQHVPSAAPPLTEQSLSNATLLARFLVDWCSNDNQRGHWRVHRPAAPRR